MDINNRNKEFLSKIDNDKELKKRRDDLIKGQHPEVLVVCCSDSRVVPEMIFSCSLGEIFVVRTAGNVISEGELATISYAIEHLHVAHIIVLGHTHCGAIHATIHNEAVKYMDPIAKRIRRNIKGIVDEKEASKVNAEKEVEYLKEMFPEFKGKIESKVYDIETSALI